MARWEAGAVAEGGDLVPPLGEGEEQGEEQGQDEEPLGDGNVDDETAGQGPEDETESEGQHVQDHHVLQAEGIAEVQPEIGGGAKAEPQVEPEREGQGGHHERHGAQGGGAYRQFARGQRPELLLRVQPILLDVGDVVPQIDRAGQAAESHEGEERAQERLRLEEVLREKQRREDEQILRPLVRAECAKKRQSWSGA